MSKNFIDYNVEMYLVSVILIGYWLLFQNYEWWKVYTHVII